MEVVANNYMPGDPRLVEQLVYELKSQGIFDQFRKECIADVDTKPAYQNLRQRVEGSVTSFLNQQTWRPDMNKNQVREQLRKNIYESGYLDTGVERIVDQVVNPKINSVFLPQVEDVVYRYLGIQKPNRLEIKKELKIDVTDLLPTDLEAISPESDHTQGDSLTFNESVNSESKMEEDESPPFEPIDTQSSNIQHEENSVDSHLSGFSGLQSHDSNPCMESKICQMELSNQDSQVSQNSSESRLSIITSEDNTKMEIREDSESKLIKSSDSNSQIECYSSKVQIITESYSVLKDETLKSVDETDSNSDNNIVEIKTVKNQEEENGIDNPNDIKNKQDDEKQTEDKKYSDRKSDEKKSRSSDKYNSKDKKDDKYRKSSSSSSSRDKEKSSSKYSSSSSSKDRIKSKDRKESRSSNKDKDKTEKDKSEKDKIKNEKEREKEKTEKEKDKDKKDKDKSDKDKTDKYKSSKEKDKSFKDKEKGKSSSTSSSSASNINKHSTSKEKEKSSSSLKSESKKDKDKPRSSSSSSRDGKSKSNNYDSKFKSCSSDKHKKDEKSTHNVKHSSSSSSSKKEKDKKKMSKAKDDHYSSKDKNNDRRSTDRDSNDGRSGRQGQINPVGESIPSHVQKSNQDSSNSNSGSGSGDSGTSDQNEPTIKSPIKIIENMEESTDVPISNLDIQKFKYLKPKFASNFQEARKLMKIRKQLAKLERHNQLSLALIEVPTETPAVNGANYENEEDSVNVVANQDDKNIILKGERKNSPVNSKSSVLQSRELSQENWEALEARLAQEMSNINYNSYESPYEDYDYSGCNSVSSSPIKSCSRTSLRCIAEKEVEKAESESNKLQESSVENIEEKPIISQIDHDIHKEKGDEFIEKNTVTTSSTVEGGVDEKDNKTISPKDTDIQEGETENKLIDKASGDIDMAGSSEFHKEDEKTIDDKSACNTESVTNNDSDSCEPCIYLEPLSPHTDKKLQFLYRYIEKLEQEVKHSLKTFQNNFVPLKGRYGKRKLENVDLKNNNKAHYEQTIDMKKRKRSVVPNPNSVISKANKEKLCNSSDISPNHSFSLPLSPAESDKSNEKRDEESPKIKQKRESVGKGINSRSQRYSSEDLYKPRLVFNSSRRSRGVKNLGK